MQKQKSFILSLLFICSINLLSASVVSANNITSILIETKKSRINEIDKEIAALKVQAAQIDKMKGGIPSANGSVIAAPAETEVPKNTSQVVEITQAVVMDQCVCNIEMESYGGSNSCKGEVTSTVNNKVANDVVCKMYKKDYAAGVCNGLVRNGYISSYYDNSKCK